MLRYLLQFLPEKTVYAHCDVPCGIYDPKPAQIAAKTVLVMVQKIDALPKNEDGWTISERANFARFVLTKEEHARKCKEELLILWTDYFKPEHLTSFPDLHETFWKAAKLCSKNKQSVDEGAAKELVAAVEDIANLFAQAQAAKKQ